MTIHNPGDLRATFRRVLTDDELDTLERRLNMDQSLEKIAAECGRTVDGIRTRIHRAKRKLRSTFPELAVDVPS